jgi:hypothetical protein
MDLLPVRYQPKSIKLLFFIMNINTISFNALVGKANKIKDGKLKRLSLVVKLSSFSQTNATQKVSFVKVCLHFHKSQ